jgi:tRNA C32,U32 (ribose-2'-O)-methylase TrmJ
MDDAELSLKEHAAREDAHAAQVLYTAKLVTTFSAALAATFLVACSR